MYGCRFYNLDYTVWFDTEEEAVQYGNRAGFQFVVEKQ
jgi:hypothetical protein